MLTLADFTIYEWRYGGEVRYTWDYWCKACENQRQKDKVANWTKGQRQRRNTYERERRTRIKGEVQAMRDYEDSLANQLNSDDPLA